MGGDGGWLDRIENAQGRFDVPLDESVYVGQVGAFWGLLTRCRGLLGQAAGYVGGGAGAGTGSSEKTTPEAQRVADLASGLQELVQGPQASTGPGSDLIAMLEAETTKLTEALMLADEAAKRDAVGLTSTNAQTTMKTTTMKTTTKTRVPYRPTPRPRPSTQILYVEDETGT